jgi:hypothetical protein
MRLRGISVQNRGYLMKKILKRFFFLTFKLDIKKMYNVIEAKNIGGISQY